MDISTHLKNQRLQKHLTYVIYLVSIFTCQISWAIQSAIVISDRAIIYADEEMSSPLGYLSKGKKIKVGDIARNKGQLYPLIVSGKMGFIHVKDVSTEKESVKGNDLVAERFLKQSKDKLRASYSLSYVSYLSQISLSKDNQALKNKDSVSWSGISLKGEAKLSERWDGQVLFNYFQGSQGTESFRLFEFGFGGALRILNFERFQVKWLTQLLTAPYSSYAYGSKFRVNGYGGTIGTGFSANFQISEHWGLEGFGGFYYTKLYGFRAPAPYNSIQPSFIGSRVGVGINYQY